MRFGKFLMIAVVLMLAVSAAAAQENALSLDVVGSYTTGVFDGGATEIVAYDPASQQIFSINGDNGTVDIISLADAAAPALVAQVDLSEYGDSPTHVRVRDGVAAVSVANDQDPGSVVFITTAGEVISAVTVGALPDMLIFTPDNTKVLTANEGEPNDDYTVDPEGSVSIIDISGGVENLTDANVTTATFEAFNADGALPEGVRVFGPGATPAQDFEPEYIAVSPDSATAYVTLQENNALAVVDIAAGTVSAVLPLGFKDFSVEGSGIDPTDEDGAINIRPVPVFGMYLPDAIEAFEVGGEVYLITANEGDSREYEDVFVEETEPQELTLDAEAFPNAAELQQESEIGKLEVTTTLGDSDGDGDYEALYAFGGRSFSIWSAADGSLIYDSGDQLEQITAAAFPDDFNSTNEENGSFEDRSDNAGPEPEGVTVGMIGESLYAFIGLERIGGIVVFDITDPTAPAFVTYVNNRDFSGDAEAGTAGDLGPEGIVFVTAENSPTGGDLLIVSNEVSGSITIYIVTAGM
ncbi:MAG: choice-of-anchor I family protein [bacterium]|nr:choice-of-anchor I family protein [bacterium]